MAKDLTVSLLLDCYGELLTERQRALSELYYNDDLSLMEIAELQGITRQGALDGISRARQQLYEFEKALGLLDLRRRVEKAVRLADALSAHVPEAAQIRELLERKEA